MEPGLGGEDRVHEELQAVDAGAQGPDHGRDRVGAWCDAGPAVSGDAERRRLEAVDAVVGGWAADAA